MPEVNEKYPMYQWACDLFPICRSLTGEGVRETLSYLQDLLSDLKIRSVPTGYRAFDWSVPDEWNIQDAYILDPEGKKILDFFNNNLHVMGYSEPVDMELDLEQLQHHLYSREDLPEAIPYVTSYYERNWGFCIADSQRKGLRPGRYRVVIKSTLAPGKLNYGELILPGKEKKEILLSTYICHPSLANNELSGPVVTTALAKWLQQRENRRFTYRIIFVPETIGAIVYLSKHLNIMKKWIVAGFVVTCVGDQNSFSFLPSRLGGTLADKVANHVLSHMTDGYTTYSFVKDRGSDERQYCSPHVNLPVVSIMRSKYGSYPEYHTSLDNLDFISQKGLEQSYELLKQCINVMEINRTWITKFPCEPQLGKRNLYDNISFCKSIVKKSLSRIYTDILSYADGDHSLLEIADMVDLPAWECFKMIEKLHKEGLIHLKI
jgi:aminopeptidase-like protein